MLPRAENERVFTVIDALFFLLVEIQFYDVAFTQLASHQQYFKDVWGMYWGMYMYREFALSGKA